MTHDDEVRALEIATKLLDHLLSWATTGGINSIGEAIVDLALQVETVEEIQEVGNLLASLTERDRVAIARGERWGKRSRALSKEEARQVLLGLTIAQAKVFADRWEYGRNEVMDWAMGYSEIHGGALLALGDRDEMAKITGETR
jgi:hypothetical protein